MSAEAAALRPGASPRLGRKLLLLMVSALGVGSLVCLVLFVTAYHARLAEERSVASTQLASFLRIALENAMLKQDLAGLEEMLARLGRQERVLRVMVLDPAGEVRFSSDHAARGRPVEEVIGACPGCRNLHDSNEFHIDPDGREVLRSVIAVANRPACAGCHGSPALNPVNGLLVIDHDASEIRRAAVGGALAMVGAGAMVVSAAVLVLAAALRQLVLRPVAALTAASAALGRGDLAARAALGGEDELARLARTFDHMAERLERSFRQLEEQDRFLQTLIDSLPDGVRVIDDEYRIVRVNRAYRLQLGHGVAEEVAGATCYASSHGRDAPCPVTLVTCPLHELARNDGPLTCRQTFVRRDGSTLPVEIAAASADLTIDGRPRRVVVEAIRDLERDARISHEQRLSELGMLAAGVAHEIRNPLSSIRLVLDRVRRWRGAEDAALAEELALVEREIDSCIDVTERLLKLALPPSEAPELVALDRVVPEVLSLLSAEAQARGIGIRHELPAGLRVVATDSEVRMLVFNLAQNAFHAMPRGGELRVAGRRAEDRVRLEVIDTGVGIPAADLGRIFDPFWSRRADGVRGTGLGLTICRAIVLRHGGRIDVESEVGRGSRFSVVLPGADREGSAWQGSPAFDGS